MTPPREAVESFEEGGLHWTAERAVASAVRERVACRLHLLDDDPGVQRIKRNLVRAVYRAPFPGEAEVGERVIVKRYAVGGLVDWVKYAFKPSRAQAEWTMGRALLAAGVPTAVPLAMAERRMVVLRDAALVTREIPDALHLNAYVDLHYGRGPQGRTARAPLYRQLATVVRRMHDAGLVHRDLHGGNVLVAGPAEEPRLHVIDLHSVARRAAVSRSAAWTDLTKLLHSLLTCTVPQERIDILTWYAQAPGPVGDPVRELLAQGRAAAALEPVLAAAESKRVRSRTARCLTRSSRFDVHDVQGYRVHHLRAIAVEGILAAVRDHDATRGPVGGRVLKSGKRSRITRQTLREKDGERTVIVKEYLGGDLASWLKNLFRPPRAVSSWVGGNGLMVRNFDVAEPLALLLRGARPFVRRSLLVMEDLGDAQRADMVVLRRFAGELEATQRREKLRLVAAAARLLRRLHARGVYHGDLKAVNLFLRPGGGSPSLVLADYDRVEFDRPVRHRRRVKNLAQLSASVAVCISLSDRLRFLREYLGEAFPDRKRWFRDIERECARKIVVRMEPIE